MDLGTHAGAEEKSDVYTDSTLVPNPWLTVKKRKKRPPKHAHSSSEDPVMISVPAPCSIILCKGQPIGRSHKDGGRFFAPRCLTMGIVEVKEFEPWQPNAELRHYH